MPLAHAYCRRQLAAALLCGCFAARAETIACHMESAKALSHFSAAQLILLAKLNHADSAHLGRLPRILVPNRWDDDQLLYSPMPADVPQLADDNKAVVVDLAGQVFGAYEYGKLVRWGPVSSGDRRHQTPGGIYHLNFHARVKVSTENPTWVMPWYFNFSSTQGLAMHEYTLPGRPASHGCVRMLSVDAQWLFHWGEGWRYAAGSDELIQPGTLVLLLGKYDFAAPPPWLHPAWWSRGISLDIEIAMPN
ncbi:MAG: L,D-transpeptidase [Bryobacteraceae bacterium]